MKNSPLVAIVGPTASGKSALAMRTAEKYNGEIIAADSRTIYKGMDIGTAKPSAADQKKVRHHLLDIRDPDQAFSAAEFKKLAMAAIDDISSRGKLPILVGGSGLYVDAVIFDYTFGPAADPGLREHLDQLSAAELQDMCRENNIAMPINNQNKRHLVRAIELNGLFRHKKQLRPHTIVVGLAIKKEKLRQRIQERAQDMVKAGVLEEVAKVGQEYHWQGEALKGNIYRVFRGVVEGTVTTTEAVTGFVSADMSLAKRQMTWFKRNPFVIWSDDPTALLGEVDTFLRQQKY